MCVACDFAVGQHEPPVVARDFGQDLRQWTSLLRW
jgi:hypothetical protein